MMVSLDGYFEGSGHDLSWHKVDPIVADLMNNTPKVVFSRTLNEVKETEYWKNIRLVKDKVADEVKKLKSQLDKNMAVYGSSN